MLTQFASKIWSYLFDPRDMCVTFALIYIRMYRGLVGFVCGYLRKEAGAEGMYGMAPPSLLRCMDDTEDVSSLPLL